ncbi:MAG: GGDEF domain-containing protein [Lachnospiraceae bacterium]
MAVNNILEDQGYIRLLEITEKFDTEVDKLHAQIKDYYQKETLIGNLCMPQLDSISSTVDVLQNQTHELLECAVNQLLQRKNQHMKDPLTGAYTQPFYELCVKKIEWDECYLDWISLVSFDIGQLKDVNLEFGHCGGNQLLKSFVNCVQKELRNEDWIYLIRIDDDKFVLLSLNLPYCEFLKVFQRIQKKLEKQTIDLDGKSILINVSFGMASLQKDDVQTLSDLRHLAVERMYRQKKCNDKVKTDGWKKLWEV